MSFRKLFPLMILTFVYTEVACPCSSFACFDSERPFYGMNFDWYPDAEIIFDVRTGEDGRRVFMMFYRLGDGDPIPTVGMNDLGFFAAMQVIDTDTGIRDPGEGEAMIWMPFYLGLWNFTEFSGMEAYLDSVTLVQYDEIPLHLMLADDQGRALVVEVGEDANRTVDIGSDPFIVMTNFSNCNSAGMDHGQVTGAGAERYIAAWEYLDDRSGMLDPDAAMEALETALNHSEGFPTRASMVFDPLERTVYIAVDRDLDRVWKVSLDDGMVRSHRGLHEDLLYSMPEGGITSAELALRVEG